MFTVTGKLLVKPRVRCPLPTPREAPPGVLVSPSCGAAWPPSSRGVTRVPCSWLLAHPQLLEDLDEQLSCTRFEEAAVSRRIASGGCSARAGEVPWGARGPQSLSTRGVSPSVSPRAGKASCWLNLNVGLLREQLLAIQSKRRKLERRHRASPWQRNLGYPLAMLGLLALTVSVPGWVPTLSLSPCASQDPAGTLTPSSSSSSSSFSSQGISVLIVCFHVLELLLDDAAMPRGIQVPGGRGEGTARSPFCRASSHKVPPAPQDAPLGQVSFSIFGTFGAALQVILILYPSHGHRWLSPALSPVPPPLSPPLSSP
ncbi:Protein LMBR1L [Aix galericulata]|nr:Protein LMBR1L [Aix galericulata]